MPSLQEMSCRMFEYSRGDQFKIVVIMKGNDFHCFGKYTMPKNVSKEVALAFYKEAERAATKRMEKELEAKANV